ncbi:T9SS type A sorting domain-containing protein [Chryseobacterium herbae]|uniref:T9SS type A sorting domain-containing protein n=1 Tax=Chryseobacterium herbae TaxID=2976476 RepID=A0ABT2J0E9_9FLAO|nr:T9SS type A sorting domain-containing protein [Chryseobacterium sp. pc1-10]MCT2564603.1 T9SS type A sorting domain-containing protein [Chryseobacterium sp. pc1-10]
MRSVLLILLVILGRNISAQINIRESFEDSTFPYGWSSTTSSGAVYPMLESTDFSNFYGAPACLGSRYVKKDITVAKPSWYLIYSTNQSNNTDLHYSFKYTSSFQDSGVAGTITTDYSTDNGVTWNTLPNLINISGSPSLIILCTDVSGVIPAGAVPSGTSFKFRIKMERVSSATSNGFSIGIDDFKLEQNPTSIPSCSGIYKPTNGQTDVFFATNIKWQPSAGATGYLLSIGTSPGGTNVIDNLDIGNVTYYKPPQNFEFFGQYFVTITPYNSFGNAACSMDVSFQITPLQCAYITSPNNIADPNAQFSWNEVVGATGYRITLGTTPTGGEILNNVDLGNIRYYTQPGGLAYSTQYYFSVTAYNNFGATQSCGTTSFSTYSGCSPWSYPQQGISGVSVKPNFSWEGIPSALGYRISLGSNDAGNNVLNNVDVGLTLQYKLTNPLTPYTVYKWAVTAYNAFPAVTNCYKYPFTTGGAVLAVDEVSEKSKDINVFPIPSKDYVFVESKKDIKRISVIDFSGRKLNDLKINNNKTDVRYLSPGNYILQIEFSDGSAYNKTITKQ